MSSKLVAPTTTGKRGIPSTPPEMRLLTVPQAEEKHPALKDKARIWIHRADAGDPDYIGLRRAIVRVGRSVFLNDVALTEFFYQRSAMPPAPPRGHGKAAA